jgi:uncharacterized protein involved in exopolysaccharide biosynthesis
MVCPLILFGLIFQLTKDEPKVFTSRTNLYTGIASGTNLMSLESSKVDRFSTITSFDNLLNIIKSRATAEEVGLRLFTSHMLLDGPSSDRISKESYDKVMRIVPDAVKKLVVKGDPEKTYQAFIEYKNKDFENFIYELTYLNHPYYSYERIQSSLKVRRISSSDIIEISYNSNEPGICQEVLKIYNTVIIRRYSQIKLIQSDAILQYFQKQLDNAQHKLDEAEDELLEFNKQNNIINYYEQSEHITIQKERFAAYYNELKMEHNATVAVLKVLENKLSAQQLKQLNNTEITELRNEIARLNIGISVKDYQSEYDTLSRQSLLDEIAEMNIESYKLQEKLRKSIDQAYFIDNSTEGVTSTTVLNQWLDNVVIYEAVKAKLLVGEEKIEEFDELVKEYAPKGSTMKRLERKIDIAEKEYLAILHSLNVAKLKQQNQELNANLKVSEAPIFPLKSEPSKRKILLLIGMFLGFMIPAFVIIALDFLNQNIRTVARAEEFTQLSVATAYPNLIKKSRSKDYAELGRLSMNKLFQSVLNLSNNLTKDVPLKVLIYSIQDAEGKTTMGTKLTERLAQNNFKSLFLNYEDATENMDGQYFKYEPDDEFMSCKSFAELAARSGDDFSSYSIVFIELPSVGLNNYPIKLFNDADMGLLTVRANRVWTEADKDSLKKLAELTQELKQGILLNGVELDEMEKVIGEIPGKRSWFRRFFKNLVSLRFHSKKEIK